MGQSVFLGVLRSQLERYIVEELGADNLSSSKNRTELRKIKKEMADLKRDWMSLRPEGQKSRRTMKK